MPRGASQTEATRGCGCHRCSPLRHSSCSRFALCRTSQPRGVSPRCRATDLLSTLYDTYEQYKAVPAMKRRLPWPPQCQTETQPASESTRAQGARQRPRRVIRRGVPTRGMHMLRHRRCPARSCEAWLSAREKSGENHGRASQPIGSAKNRTRAALYGVCGHELPHPDVR